jgi:magnesium transporter
MTTEQEATTDIERLRALLHGDDVEAARELLSAMHPADQAEVFDEELDEAERETVLALLGAEGAADLLEHLDDDLRPRIVDDIPRATLAQILDRTEPDVAVDILREMAPAEAVRTLAQMASAAEIMPLMQHKDETAGGIMTRGYITLHKDMTVEEAIAFLRATKPLAEEAYYLYVLDGQSRLQGVVSLRQLVVSDPVVRIEDVMARDVTHVAPDTDQEEAARLLQHYRLRSLPVVDEAGVLQGVITSDDIIDVIQEEATEDMFRIAGLPADESIYAPLSVSARRRIPWLILNLFTALAAGAIVAIFEGTIADAAALAVFMPIVAGQGGNAGIQTVTIVVRGIALGEVEPRDAWEVLRKEFALGLIRGVIFAVLVGGAALLWQGNWAWGAVVGGAMLLNMLVAALMGTFIPLGMRKLGFDPAIASGVFLTAFTDVLGFLFLLGFGALAISRLT